MHNRRQRHKCHKVKVKVSTSIDNTPDMHQLTFSAALQKFLPSIAVHNKLRINNLT